MTTQSPAPTDLLEQAHLALMRGHLAQARSLLEQLITAEPHNAEAQDLRATVIAQQATLSETALQARAFPSAVPPAQTGSVWTRPVPDPVSALLNTSSSRKWPKPLLLLACLLAGILTSLLPGRHHSIYSSWREDMAFGLAAGVVLFIYMAVRKR
jgi:hypothetical protein